MSTVLQNLYTDHLKAENITLLVSPDQEDYLSLADMLAPDHWTVRCARSMREASRLLSDSRQPSVVACERELPDGNWKDLYDLMSGLRNPPPLIVLSRHADEFLWAEVLNLGGYDVLAKPLDPNEVHRVVNMASRHGAAHHSVH